MLARLIQLFWEASVEEGCIHSLKTITKALGLPDPVDSV